MKLFISADIEGTTGITLWDETENGHARYPCPPGSRLCF